MRILLYAGGAFLQRVAREPTTIQNFKMASTSTQILVQAASNVDKSNAMEDNSESDFDAADHSSDDYSPSSSTYESEEDENVPEVKFYVGPDLTNYRMQPVRCDLGQYETCPPAMFVEQQRRELAKNVMEREAVALHEENPLLIKCNLCLTNVATRVAVPCGHFIGCIDCVVALIETRNFYQIEADLNDEEVPLPIKCPQCNALVGMLLMPH